MRSIIDHLFLLLDHDLSQEAVNSLSQAEAGKLANLLYHWQQLADRRAGPLTGAAVSRETPPGHPGAGRESQRARDRALETLLEAGGDLAQEMQTIIDEAKQDAEVDDSEPVIADVQALVDRWEDAYCAFGAGDDPVSSEDSQGPPAP